MTLPVAFLHLLLQASPTPTDVPDWLLEGVFIAIVIVALVIIIGIILVSIWMARDCRQRGENPGLWVTLFAIGSFIPVGIIGGIVILVIYLLVRPKEIRYDKHGNALMPSAPPPGWGTAPTGWSSSSPGAWNQPSPPMPTAPPPWPQKLSKVKCPRCQTIFDYQKQPTGLTHVKCPNCGEEGDI